MSRRLGMVTVTAITLIAVGVVPGAGAPGGSFTHLNPGGPPNLPERIPINFVFVGYDPSQVNQATFLAQLPARARPVVRSRLWYGVVEPVGLHYSFQYRVTYTDAAYENQFFTALRALATPAERTLLSGDVQRAGQQRARRRTESLHRRA